MKTAKQKPAVKETQITFATALAVRKLIGRFAISCYEDVEAVKPKIDQLEGVLNQFSQDHSGDQAKANEMFNTESQLTKTELAYMSKDDFKQAIHQRGFELDQIQLLEYWLVKN
jgi:hypothetical protein